MWHYDVLCNEKLSSAVYLLERLEQESTYVLSTGLCEDNEYFNYSEKGFSMRHI